MDGAWGDSMTDTHDPADGLRLVVLEDADDVADHATAHIVQRLKAKPDLVLGFPTGATPRGIYARLVKAHRSGEVSFRECRQLQPG